MLQNPMSTATALEVQRPSLENCLKQSENTIKITEAHTHKKSERQRMEHLFLKTVLMCTNPEEKESSFIIQPSSKVVRTHNSIQLRHTIMSERPST